MQIPILSGIYTDENGDVRTSYPRNMMPIAAPNGVSNGYLRPADGIVQFGTGPGIDRGGINWNGACYRVMGTKLVRIDSLGTATTLGDVGGSGLVTMDYSFDRLAIASGGSLFYWNGSTLTQVTDPDLGTVVDFCWVDGYFLTTDGTFLIVTELNDPLSVNPLKYGSSEIDPDPVLGIYKLRNEIYALNRYTIEVFDNVGGSLFPFARINGAQIQRGVVGTHAAAIFMDNLAFLGSGRGEAIGVYLGANSQSQHISTAEIDRILSTYTETQLSTVLMESRLLDGQWLLYIHLPDRTLVYNGTASQSMQAQVWFELVTSLTDSGQYLARNFVYCYDQWLVGNPASAVHGRIVENISTHWGQSVAWEFGTQMLYNEAKGAIFHELELVALPGRVALGANPAIWTSYTLDGETWSQLRPCNTGSIGNRGKRIRWLQCGTMRQWRAQRFQGISDAHLSVMRLEATMEPLNV
ncbi:MAG: hypothetical protein ING25_11915 [Burkholderiales bacterium]|nr:hypothetical protein [Burkholderiales bacterium]